VRDNILNTIMHAINEEKCSMHEINLLAGISNDELTILIKSVDQSDYLFTLKLYLPSYRDSAMSEVEMNISRKEINLALALVWKMECLSGIPEELNDTGIGYTLLTTDLCIRIREGLKINDDDSALNLFDEQIYNLIYHYQYKIKNDKKFFSYILRFHEMIDEEFFETLEDDKKEKFSTIAENVLIYHNMYQYLQICTWESIRELGALEKIERKKTRQSIDDFGFKKIQGCKYLPFEYFDEIIKDLFHVYGENNDPEPTKITDMSFADHESVEVETASVTMSLFAKLFSSGKGKKQTSSNKISIISTDNHDVAVSTGYSSKNSSLGGIICIVFSGCLFLVALMYYNDDSINEPIFGERDKGLEIMIENEMEKNINEK
jgi:hypothetical protein